MRQTEAELFADLGKIVLNFSTLEFVLACFVTRLISDDSKVGAIVTSEMSFQNLLKAFDSLTQYRITDPPVLAKVSTLIKRLNASEQERNKIIHSVYALPDNDKKTEFTRLKATAKQGKGLKISEEVIDTKVLKDLTLELRQLVIDLESLYKSLFNDEIIKYG